MCRNELSLLPFATVLTCAVFTSSVAAADVDAAEHQSAVTCPVPGSSDSALDSGKPAVRRLRTVLAPGPEAGSLEADLAELAFVTSTRPNPKISSIVQAPGGDEHTRLRVTVVNNSRHASPDGGITLSFPKFTRRSDRARVGDVVVPEGMALHVIPAGDPLFGRNGREQTASHLMIEVHGAWQPRQSRTLEVEVSDLAAPVPVRYRSALSDDSGAYHNAPARSGSLDQQGWPVLTCTIGSSQPVMTRDERITVRAHGRGGRD